MGDPQITMGFHTKMVQLWMIWGYPATRSRKGIVSPPFCGNQAVLGESAHLRLITGTRTLGG